MKKLTVLLFVFISFGLFAQDACLKITKDKASGVITKETKYGKLSVGATKVLGFTFNKVGDVYNTKVSYKRNETEHYFVAKDCKLIFTLKNNSQIVLYSNNDYEADMANIGKPNRTFTLAAIYKTEKQQLEEMNKIGLKHLRIYFENTYADEEISEANSSIFTGLINCILSK